MPFEVNGMCMNKVAHESACLDLRQTIRVHETSSADMSIDVVGFHDQRDSLAEVNALY